MEIDVREGSDEGITRIVFGNIGGYASCIRRDSTTNNLTLLSNSGQWQGDIRRLDVDNLIKALQKAKEIGWAP